MTEAEWLAGDDAAATWDAVGPTLSARKVRLFAAATAAANPSAVQRHAAAGGLDAPWRREGWAAADDLASALGRLADGEVSPKRVRRLVGRIPEYLGPFTGEAAEAV